MFRQPPFEAREHVDAQKKRVACGAAARARVLSEFRLCVKRQRGSFAKRHDLHVIKTLHHLLNNHHYAANEVGSERIRSTL